MPEVQRVETIHLKWDAKLSPMCHLSKNLYNEANYIIRQTFINEGNWIRYYDLCKLLINSENYKGLPAQTAQGTLLVLDKSWKSFFNSIKAWKAHPEKYRNKPGLPRYKDKDGEFTLFFTNQQVKIKEGNIIFPKKVGLSVKTRLTNDTTLNGARIIPEHQGYRLEIIHTIEVPDASETSSRIAGIDLGVNNLLTVTNNIGEQPLVIPGGPLKSMNQYYNKRLAQLKSIYDRQGVKGGSKLKKLCQDRNRKVKDYMHKASTAIINWCVEHEIDTIVVGRNKEWKQEVNIGRRNNQNFVSIPFYILFNQLTYKAENKGIRFVEQDEAHTSKCSFLDNEEVMHHEEYAGRRISRGLFRASDGRLINADVNGGYNITKKAFPEAFAEGIEGVGFHPVRLSVIT